MLELTFRCHRLLIKTSSFIDSKISALSTKTVTFAWPKECRYCCYEEVYRPSIIITIATTTTTKHLDGGRGVGLFHGSLDPLVTTATTAQQGHAQLSV